MSKKIRILSVDDEPMNLKIFQNIFADDHDLEVVSTGLEALDLVEKKPFDVVLLDIMMPDLDGYEVCQRMKKNEKSQFIKIILVSAKITLPDRLKGYTYGADDYITKPFDENEILAKVSVYSKLKFTEEIDQLKTTLLSAISHRIRTPLTSILGFSSVLEMNTTINDLGKRQLQQIVDGGNQLLDLTQKSILFCELKRGIQLSFKDVLLQEYIKKIIKIIQNKAGLDQKKIFYSNLTNEKVSCDIYYLETALLFILENVIRSSAENSVVEVISKKEKGSWKLLIKNVGEGIGSKNIEELSSVFLEDINEQDSDDDMMGLIIAYRIIKLHQGNVEVLTDSQEETVLVVKVPVVNKKEVSIDETKNSNC